MKRKILFTVAFIACFSAAFAWFADMNGNWKGSITAPDGNEYPLSYTIKIDGDKLTGTSSGQQGSVDLTAGKVKGDSLWFNVDVGGTNVPHAGKYFTAGDSISMNIDYMGMKFHSTLKRAADK